MTAITETQLVMLARKLDSEEARVSAALTSDTSALSGMSRPDPGDRAEIAEAEAANWLGDAMRDHQRSQLADIAAARSRMDSGCYGQCMACGEPIPYERLEAYPTAKRCAACQRDHERMRRDVA